ncbi:MAG TPA: hypothetical protein VK601_01770, partial [Kofleriaceae bacterium]|nr:hypothetical protein [Kofleriaceae bacterium]
MPGKTTLVGAVPIGLQLRSDPSAPANARGSAGSGGSAGSAGSGGSTGPLDRLRAAVQAGSAAGVSAEYQALQPADKVAVAHDARLVADMVRVLDPSAALVVLRDLALPRRTLLQVASSGKPGDPAFLAEVLRLAALDNLSALAAGAGEVQQFPAFASRAVIDPIINAAGVTAMAQLQLASTAGGQALLQVVYPGQIPIEFLTTLRADLGT